MYYGSLLCFTIALNVVAQNPIVGLRHPPVIGIIIPALTY